MIDKKILQYIYCPSCKGDLFEETDYLVCKQCTNKYEVLDKNIAFIVPHLTDDVKLSIKKWDTSYESKLVDGSYRSFVAASDRDHHENEYSQLNAEKNIDKDIVFLEIGCGTFALGQFLADKVKLVIGMDFSPSALKIAKKLLDEKGIKNYLLIQGDISSIPIKDSSVDIIFGGGVIEHFQNTKGCIGELHRILKPNGISFNTVPYLNIGSLTYRQTWGNIPNVPILKQIAELIHIRLLGARHMRFGYEMSFTAGKLKNIHRKAGFNNVKIQQYKVGLVLNFIPKRFRALFTRLADSNRLFWPMIKVVAKKD